MKDFSSIPLEPRALARLTQTNVTPNPIEAIDYGLLAMTTWDALQDDEKAADTTLQGEVAAKLGLRTAQAGYGLEDIYGWFDTSHRLLDPDDPRHERERVATYLLEGRTLGWLALTDRHQDRAVELSQDASEAFSLGAISLRTAIDAGVTDRHDPYWTMLNRHRVTHESVARQLPAARVRQLARISLGAAIAARPENANTPDNNPSRLNAKHARFVGKQLINNLANMPLIASMPLADKPAVEQRRRAYAARLLG